MSTGIENIQKEMYQPIGASINQEQSLQALESNDIIMSEADNHISDDREEIPITEISQHYSYCEPSSDMEEELEEEELEEKEAAVDNSSLVCETFHNELRDDGFCQWSSYQRYKESVNYLTVGFIRHQLFPLNDIGHVIIQFYQLYGNEHVEIQSGQNMYFTLMPNISLSKILVSRAKQSAVKHIIIELEEVKTETLEHILTYLAHHKENEFEHTLRWTDGNSMNTTQIVNNEWDRDWINGFDTDTLIRIKKAARHLKIISLVQLAGIPMITKLFDMSRFL